MACPHENFEAYVAVNRIEDIGAFAADVTVKCSDCGTPFYFLGLPGGLHIDRPTISVDGTEARLPIYPVGEIPVMHTSTGAIGFAIKGVC